MADCARIELYYGQACAPRAERLWRQSREVQLAGMAISSIVPSAEEFIKLPVDERAWVLVTEAGGASAKNLHLGNFLNPNAHHVRDGYPAQHHPAVEAGVIAAFKWLENRGYLSPEGSSPDFLQMSPQGAEWYRNHFRTASRELNRRATAPDQGRFPTQKVPPGPAAPPDALVAAAESPERQRKVFVVHGRDERLRRGMFEFLRAIGLDPIEWGRATALTGKASPYIGEVLNAAFRHAQAVVVLLTPDDEARLRRDLIKENDPECERRLKGQPRPNVLFEAGMAFATHSDQTVLVRIGEIRPFSDVAGRHTVDMDGSFAKRQDLALKLRTAGCAVDLDGTDWHSAGDLTPSSTPGGVGETQLDRPPQKTGDTFSAKSGLQPLMQVTIVPVSRSTPRGEYFLTKVDHLGVVIELPSGDRVRVPRADFIESWDDARQRPKLELTRKYLQGYFPGSESAEEFFLPR